MTPLPLGSPLHTLAALALLNCAFAQTPAPPSAQLLEEARTLRRVAGMDYRARVGWRCGNEVIGTLEAAKADAARRRERARAAIDRRVRQIMRAAEGQEILWARRLDEAGLVDGPLLLVSRASDHFRAGRVAEATDLFTRTLAAFPKRIPDVGLINAAVVFEQTGRRSDAERALDAIRPESHFYEGARAHLARLRSAHAPGRAP